MPENKGGRPRIIQTPEEFEKKSREYFAVCEAEERPPTIAGIAYHLGFADRRSFYDYEKEDGFSHTVKRARLRIEQHHEQRMSGNNPTGSIFWLKNHDWKDTQDQNVRFPEGPPVRVYMPSNDRDG